MRNDLFERKSIYINQKDFLEFEDMIAGTVLLRMHDDANLIAMQEDWFEHVNRYCTKRDQLSFNYLRWPDMVSIRGILMVLL